MNTVVSFRSDTYGSQYCNSNKIYFFLIAKIEKKGNRRKQIFQISNLSVLKRF